MGSSLSSRLSRYASVAAIVLMSGCSHMPDNPAKPAQPSASAPSLAKAAPPTRLADPEVRAAQDYLARLGYYRGPIDGISGPKTRTAVANYQTDSGLPPDGKVSRDLIAQLAAMPATPALRDKVDRMPGPIYEPGDAYIYTDGQVETVLSIGDRRVEWQDATGQRWSADVDFTVPSPRSDPGADVASRQPFTWPIRVGSRASYTVQTATSNQAQSDQDAVKTWHCLVEDRERTAVLAGTFDSYKIWLQCLLACWAGRLKQELVSNGRCPTPSRPNLTDGLSHGRAVLWQRASSLKPVPR
jgi:peptidoglycan hydrolase-like protein with peptidoglycan-binding domain